MLSIHWIMYRIKRNRAIIKDFFDALYHCFPPFQCIRWLFMIFVGFLEFSWGKKCKSPWCFPREAGNESIFSKQRPYKTLHDGSLSCKHKSWIMNMHCFLLRYFMAHSVVNFSQNLWKGVHTPFFYPPLILKPKLPFWLILVSFES